MPALDRLCPDDRKPSASVLLKCMPANLEPAQVWLIVNLVATRVPELARIRSDRRQNGNLLSDQNEFLSERLSLAVSFLIYTRVLEDTFTRRVHNHSAADCRCLAV